MTGRDGSRAAANRGAGNPGNERGGSPQSLPGSTGLRMLNLRLLVSRAMTMCSVALSPPVRGPSIQQPQETAAFGGLPRHSLYPGDQPAFDTHHTARTAKPLHRSPRPCPARDRGARAGTVLDTVRPATPTDLTSSKMLRGRAPGRGSARAGAQLPEAV